MTGLEPDRHVIVEIATIITDDDLNVIGEGPDLVIGASPEQLAQMGEFVTEMHTKSGLNAAFTSLGPFRCAGTRLVPTVGFSSTTCPHSKPSFIIATLTSRPSRSSRDAGIRRYSAPCPTKPLRTERLTTFENR
jgi:hypothetical protein